MQPLDLIELQIRLEYHLDESGRLVPFPGSSEQALYIVYRYTQGYVPYFSYLLPHNVCEWLMTFKPKEAFDQPGKVVKLIDNAYRPCSGGDQVFWSGYFANPLELNWLPAVTREEHAWVVKVDGQVVCRAISVRQNAESAEVYVETRPDFRMRGYGRQSVSVWARDILNSGRVPFYSYHLNNIASAALAHSLGIVWYADVVAFEPI